MTQPPPPSPTATNLLLGRYELGRMLGRGSFAKVYSAKSVFDQSPVAIKIIDKTKTIDASMEPRIISEVTAMRRLQDHPNILKIHEVMASKTKIYLVMELATGGELFAKVLRRGRLSESSARRYFHQLVNALHFCHQNGIAHRDVKPQNLLLDVNGDLKVSDFGLSALPEQKKDGLLHTFCGTPSYTAPEVMSRRHYDGSKADAWSCGVILFFLLSGSLPAEFDSSNYTLMYKKIRQGNYIPSYISKPARSVISKLLDLNPTTRMSLEQLMTTKWFKKSTIPRNVSKDSFGSSEDGEESSGLRRTLSMNAFDIISLSSSFDLSGLFEEVTKRKELKRFTTAETTQKVVERVREVGGKLGYRVERVQADSVGLVKGKTVVDFEVSELAAQLLLVEVRAVGDGGAERQDGGGGGCLWEELREGLEDVALSWHSETCVN
ncbi:CBL-interacting serine/threonine-protein kinase 7-like [Rutidosis leptorrhynchoides]|uniref:CBL-interacting serine/threonine-protein kinase 7-like n=1 Tax=Rutidosis leptorrhynchoides TaxID=125765 RepID=UPI003A996639